MLRQTYGKGPISSKSSYMHHPTDRIEHTTTSRETLAGTRHSSIGLAWRIDLSIHRTTSERSLTSRGWNPIYLNGSTMKNRSDDPSLHKRTLLEEQWLEPEISQWVHHGGSIRRSIAPQANAPWGAMAGTRNISMGPPSWIIMSGWT